MMVRVKIALGKTSATESRSVWIEAASIMVWCLPLFHQWKLAKMQWLQDSNQNNIDNLNNVIRQASRHSGTKRRYSWKLRLMNLKLTVQSDISETSIGTSRSLSEGLPAWN